MHEGIELRQAGINVPLVILEETPHQGAEKVVEYDLTAAACSFLLSAHWDMPPKTKTVKVHVRVDKLRRPELLPGILGVARKIKEMSWLEVEGIFTTFSPHTH